MSEIDRHWIPLAWRSDGFADFRPFVPGVDDTGAVVFQASLAEGGSGVFLAHDGLIRPIFRAAPDETVASHPHRNAHGETCVYLTRTDGSSALLLLDGVGSRVVVDSRDAVFSAIGPLGPVIDAYGGIAFRAALADGRAAIGTWSRGEVSVLACAGERFSAFYGLPLPAGAGGAVFRADRPDGVQGVYRARAGHVEPVIELAAGDGSLASFPGCGVTGEVFCGWMSGTGEARVLCASPGEPARPLDTGDVVFESLRGCLPGGSGVMCFTGTPRGGRLGAYRCEPGGVQCLIEEGATMAGARVEGFALNPVSTNARGKLAVRVLLDDGRQVIALSVG